jgi:hypothetical protein
MVISSSPKTWMNEGLAVRDALAIYRWFFRKKGLYKRENDKEQN